MPSPVAWALIVLGPVRVRDCPSAVATAAKPVGSHAGEAADDGDHRILSAVEKPNRAVLAAVCNSKAVSLKGIGRVNDVKYYQELARMFASSLGPAGTASKATVDAAAHAMQLQLRHSPCSRQQSGRRRQSSSF